MGGRIKKISNVRHFPDSSLYTKIKYQYSPQQAREEGVGRGVGGREGKRRSSSSRVNHLVFTLNSGFQHSPNS